MAEKLTLAYAHSLMPYPTTWHVAAAYLAWCPCHGAETMQQLLSQLPIQAGPGLMLTSCYSTASKATCIIQCGCGSCLYRQDLG